MVNVQNQSAVRIMQLVLLQAILLLAAPRPAIPANPVNIKVMPSHSDAWIGDAIEIVLRLSIRIPESSPRGIEPLSPPDPPHLHVPWFQPDSLPGMQGPNMREMLQPWLTLDRNRAAFTINDFIVETGFITRSQPARFLPDRQWIDRDGQGWIEYILRTQWLAEREGEYLFGPVTFTGKVAVASDERGRLTAWRELHVVDPGITIRVNPAPRATRPETFFGAVGTFMNAEIDIDPLTCRLGDPVRLRLQIGGDIRHDRLHPPRLTNYSALSNMFNIHQETVRTLTTDTMTEFIYLVSPTRVGAIEIPPIELSWFDRHNQNYTSVTTRPLPMQVLPAQRLEHAASPTHFNNRETQRSETAADQTSAALRSDPDGWRNISWRKERNLLKLMALGPTIYLLAMLPGFLPRATTGLRRRQRQNAAFKGVVRKLRRIAVDSAAPPLENALALRQAVNRYFAEILDTADASDPPADFWRTVAQDYPDFIPSVRFREIMEHCDLQCYTESGNLLFDPHMDTEILLRDLEATHAIRPQRESNTARSGALKSFIWFAIAILCLSLPLAVLLHKTEDVHDQHTLSHIWEEANRLAGLAVNQAEFQAARLRYQSLMDAGMRNGTLYYNYGTACLESGDFEAAITALRTARKIEGSAPDINHNLHMAHGKKALTLETAESRPQFRNIDIAILRFSSVTRWRVMVSGILTIWLAASVIRLRRMRKALGVFFRKIRDIRDRYS